MSDQSLFDQLICVRGCPLGIADKSTCFCHPKSRKLFEEHGSFLDMVPLARATDPETSHQAAAIAKTHAGGNRLLAWEKLRQAGRHGLTDFELADRTGIAQTSIGVRRHELVNMKLVEKTDMRRPSPSGAPAIVWRAVQ